MPGLLRGVARTAVIAGTASAVSGRVQRRQAERFADRDAQIYQQRGAAYAAGYEAQQAAAAPPPASAPAEDPTIAKLRQLAELHEQGVLTDEEFAAQKAKVLNG
jgi:hypothetical protein